MASFEHANASMVTDELWIGGDLSTYDEEVAPGFELRELVEHGLTHILDVREEWSDEEHVRPEPAPGRRTSGRGIPDLGQAVGTQWFDAGVEFAMEALSAPGKVVPRPLPRRDQPRPVDRVRDPARPGPRPGRGARDDPRRHGRS